MSKKFLSPFSCIGVIYIIYQLSGFEVVYAYTENFFEESKNGDMSQWKDLWTAMVLLVAMVSFFLLIVGLMFRLVGQDLAMDPR